MKSVYKLLSWITLCFERTSRNLGLVLIWFQLQISKEPHMKQVFSVQLGCLKNADNVIINSLLLHIWMHPYPQSYDIWSSDSFCWICLWYHCSNRKLLLAVKESFHRHKMLLVSSANWMKLKQTSLSCSNVCG